MPRCAVVIGIDGMVEIVGPAGEVVGRERRRRRVSHVEPQSLPLRLAFRLLRSVVSDNSRLAEWTRRWPCRWRVRIVGFGSEVIADGFRDRAAAIEWELGVIVPRLVGGDG